MINKFLLPNKFKIPGWILFIPATVLGVILTTTGFEIDWFNAKVFAIFSDGTIGKSQKFGLMETNITNTVIGILFIIGAMLVGFSKEKRKMNLLPT
jgi:hypothetical protein